MPGQLLKIKVHQTHMKFYHGPIVENKGTSNPYEVLLLLDSIHCVCGVGGGGPIVEDKGTSNPYEVLL